MRYRPLGKTGILVSEIGLGCEHLEGKEYEVIKATIDAGMEAGINILDVFMSEPKVRTNIGKALRGKREKVYIQGHFRAIWRDNQYGRTLDLSDTKYFFEDLLTRLETNYIDIGMIHMIDNQSDYEAVFQGEIIEYVLSLKKKGIIRSVGISSHNPIIALEAVKTGLIDVLLFSINPAYDLLDENITFPDSLTKSYFEKLQVNGINPVREELYKTCEAMGVGITVMKGLAAGALLEDKKSPFGVAMTVPQCVHYALTRPGVSSVLTGLKSPSEVAAAVAYETMTEAQLDYSKVLTAIPKFSLKGHCMYCNHCLPCTSHINIAEVNKYLDLANMSDTLPPTIKSHYLNLENTAQDCIQCGICEASCPFEVPIMERMEKAVLVFGK